MHIEIKITRLAEKKSRRKCLGVFAAYKTGKRIGSYCSKTPKVLGALYHIAAMKRASWMLGVLLEEYNINQRGW